MWNLFSFNFPILEIGKTLKEHIFKFLVALFIHHYLNKCWRLKKKEMKVARGHEKIWRFNFNGSEDNGDGEKKTGFLKYRFNVDLKNAGSIRVIMKWNALEIFNKFPLLLSDILSLANLLPPQRPLIRDFFFPFLVQIH